MKLVINTLLSTILLSTAFVANADNRSNSESAEHPYTQLCKAALVSEKAFVATARKLNITKDERQRLVCNDLTVEEFTNNYRLTEQNTIANIQ